MKTPLPENRESAVRRTLGKHWDPNPIDPPTVDPELPKLGGIQRAAEVFRYSILSVEWWLSPNGTLRAWVKLNGKLGSFLMIPAVLVMPLVGLILWQIATWMGFLLSITGNLIVLPLAALLATAILAGAVALIRAIFGR